MVAMVWRMALHSGPSYLNEHERVCTITLIFLLLFSRHSRTCILTPQERAHPNVPPDPNTKETFQKVQSEPTDPRRASQDTFFHQARRIHSCSFAAADEGAFYEEQGAQSLTQEAVGVTSKAACSSYLHARPGPPPVTPEEDEDDE